MGCVMLSTHVRKHSAYFHPITNLLEDTAESALIAFGVFLFCRVINHHEIGENLLCFG